MSASDKKKLRKEQRMAAMTEKQKAAQKEAKKLKAYTLTFAIVMVLVVAIVIGVIVSPMISGAIRNNSHAITVGDHDLNTVELSYFYVDAITEHQNEIYSQYYGTFGNYWSFMLGYDTTKPLNEQVHDSESGDTWADHFIDEAIESAKSVYALYDDAMKNNYELDKDAQKNLDDTLNSLSAAASYYGYSSAESYLRATYGNGANEDSYRQYYTISTIASSYYNEYHENLEYEAEDYRAYEKDRYNDYSSYSYVYYTINYNSYLPEGKKDEDGNTTWTEAEKKAAREAAKADMEALLAAGIKDKATFDKAVQALKINEVDPDDEKATLATATEIKNKLYTDIVLHEDAVTWLAEKDRKPGDIGTFAMTTTESTEKIPEDHEHGEDCGHELVTNGYYVVLFTGMTNNEVHLVNVRHILVAFEGGTKDDSGNVTYSVKEKEAAKTEAEKLLKQWQDGKATEDSFGELANKNSDDQGGKVTNGGLYEDIYPGQMVEAFENWCFAEGRKAGDTGIVETEYGYHVMYFSSTDELTFRDYMIEIDMAHEDLEKWHDALVEKIKATIVDLSHMEYDLVVD